MKHPDHSTLNWRAAVDNALSSGSLAEALALVRAAASSQPGSPDVWSILGSLSMQAGDLATAEPALRRCLALAPQHVDSMVNLASLLMSTGRTSDALGLLKEAHQIQPGHLGAWLVLARSRLMLGDAIGAEKCLRAAEVIQADLPAQALFQLAGVLQERKAFQAAAPYYERAIAKDPNSFLYRSNFADMLCNIGEIDRGFAQHREVLLRQPDRLRSHLALSLTLPGVYADAPALHAARARFAEGLDDLIERADRFRARPASEIESDIRWCNYLLAYQGEDDRLLQEKFADFQSSLLKGVAPTLANRPARQPEARIRIGFASSFFYNCTVGWYFSSWILDLDPARFDPFIYSLGPVRDDLSEKLAASGQYRQVHHLPLFKLAETILGDDLDVLVFPELGLCPTTFSLASLRLAPLQCAGWGHPVTSGHGNVDIYFSSDLIEPPDAQLHYREKLIRLPGLGTRYPRPGNHVEVTRAQFELPDEAPLALVSQSLFKIHPDNDALYQALFASVPTCHLLFFQDTFDRNTELFCARLESRGLRRGREFTFLPRMSRAEFLGVNRMADVMLDTLHWSGGNTSMDALSMGLPIVAWPGRFMRGRQSLGMLRSLGCEELAVNSAERYVEVASSLLTNANIRHTWRERILAAAHILYDQTAAPAALQDELAQAFRRITTETSLARQG